MDLSNSTLSNAKLNEILSGYTGLNTLNVNDCTNLTSLDFVENMEWLEQLFFLNTGITGDEVEKLDTYAIRLKSFKCNNSGVNLTKMQGCINRTQCYTGSYAFQKYVGAGLQGWNLISKLSSYSNITWIVTNGMALEDGSVERELDLSRTSLKSAYIQSDNRITIKLPSTFGTDLTEGQYAVLYLGNEKVKMGAKSDNIRISFDSNGWGGGFSKVADFLTSVKNTNSTIKYLRISFRSVNEKNYFLSLE